jgi:hypothetical protein
LKGIGSNENPQDLCMHFHFSIIFPLDFDTCASQEILFHVSRLVKLHCEKEKEKEATTVQEIASPELRPQTPKKVWQETLESEKSWLLESSK